MRGLITWKQVFTTEHKDFFNIHEVVRVFIQTGYPYFLWEGRIYFYDKASSRVVASRYKLEDIGG